METESITVDPFAKAKKLSFTDLTGAGKAVAVSPNERCVGHESVEGRTAPDSQTISSEIDGKSIDSARIVVESTERDTGRTGRAVAVKHSLHPRLSNPLGAGNTANRGRVPVRDESVLAGKETETELSDAGEQGQIGDSNPQSERPSFVGSVTSGGIPAAVPDSQNPYRFLIARSSEKPSKMDGNS